jgi:hypothetical protein
MPRRKEPGFTQKQAARFRSEFRRLCRAYSVTNDAVGEGIDILDGNANSSGAKEVANAMTAARKITYRVARRLVAGLFISKPLKRIDVNEAAAGLGDIVGLLARFGAVSLERSSHLPIFISQDKADGLAERLSGAALAVRGINKNNRATLARALAAYLRENAPDMARAWCDATQQGEVLAAARLDFAEVQRVTESLAKVIFRERYVYQSEGPSWGPEFGTLARECPELMCSLAIPLG